MIQDEDKLFKELFSDYKPKLSNSDAFQESLYKKLDKVEYIKAVQNAQIHRYKISVLISLACGLIAGGIFSLLIMNSPIDVPLFTFTTTNTLFLTLQHYSRLISVVFISGLLCCAIISIANIVQEMHIYADKRMVKIYKKYF